MNLPLDCFATSETVSFGDEDIPGVTITYGALAAYLDKAEKLQSASLSGTGKKSKRRTRKRKYSSSSVEELLSDRENVFRDAEKGVEERATDEDRDFSGAAAEAFDIPQRRRSKRIMRMRD